jgi:hypothetical protein
MELDLKHFIRVAAAFGLAVMFGVLPLVAHAGTTGTISGVVRAQGGAPLAGVTVTAVSPSYNASTRTDVHGFYSLLSLVPDTYTVTFAITGYGTVSVPSVVVQQDQNISLNEALVATLQTIAHVQAIAGSSLVKPNQGSDVYNVSGQELAAATNPGMLQNNLYQWTAVVPGVTGTGFPAQPRVRGGQVTDLGYEFEGIPIQDNMLGFFSTNLSNVGVENVEVYTGGLSAEDAANGSGFLNSVLRTGTYPGYNDLAVGLYGPDYEHALTFQSGYATPDHRWSYYIGFSGTNAQNDYSNGAYTFPAVLFHGFDGPGQFNTRDLVGNFHYKPDPNDDIQVVVTNSYADIPYDYLLDYSSNAPPALGTVPCPGAAPAGNTTWSGGVGGFAPNGQYCPEGLYFTGISPNKGNVWYHYGGLGKVQWNHNINDHSSITLLIGEDFNEYIFDQAIVDPNSAYWESYTAPGYAASGGQYNWGEYGFGNPTVCPNYPYKAGSPVQAVQYAPIPPIGVFDCVDWFGGIEGFYGDRRSEMYVESVNYENLVNDNFTIKAGFKNIQSDDLFNYYLTSNFTEYGGTCSQPYGNFNPVTGLPETCTPSEFSWPYKDQISTFPTSEPQAWAEGDFRVGKWLLEPGIMFAAEHYAFPGGLWESIWNPTFNGTYEFSSKDVVRFSVGDTSSFIGSAYVYTAPDSGAFNGFSSDWIGPGINLNPNTCESISLKNPKEVQCNSYRPQLNHWADFSYEHQFDAETSVRITPWVEKTSNYFEEYKPVIGYKLVKGVPTPQYGAPILADNQKHQDFGIEFGLQRVDNHPVGVSFWLTATLDNYWTTATSLPVSFESFTLPYQLINEGVMVRASGNPLWNTNLLFDIHDGGFHFAPMVTYQTDYFFNTGYVVNNQITEPEQIASAFWNVQLQAWQNFGPQDRYFVGFQIFNLTNNDDNFNLTPCVTDGTGCYPFDGPQSGVMDTPGSLIYQPTTQNPRTFMVMAGTRLQGMP